MYILRKIVKVNFLIKMETALVKRNLNAVLKCIKLFRTVKFSAQKKKSETLWSMGGIFFECTLMYLEISK